MANIKLGGLWANTDKNGNEYLSGYLGDAKLLVFTNSYHTAENKQPTHIMYLTPKEAKAGTARFDDEQLGTEAVDGANDGMSDAQTFDDPFVTDTPPTATPRYRWARTHNGTVKMTAEGTFDDIARQLSKNGCGSRVAHARIAARVLDTSPASSQTIASNGGWVEMLNRL